MLQLDSCCPELICSTAGEYNDNVEHNDNDVEHNDAERNDDVEHNMVSAMNHTP